MIKQLNQQQIDRMPYYVDKWIKIGLSTDPIDKDRVTEVLSRVYRAGGMRPPRETVFITSPYHWDSVRASVWDSVRDSVWDSVWASVWDSVWDSVRDSVWDSVRDSVLLNQGDTEFFATVDYLVSELGIGPYRQIEPLMELSQLCGFVFVGRDTAIACERAQFIHRNQRGQLHNPNGKAVEYSDGCGLYAWNGTRIPDDKAWVITQPHTISATSIEGEINVEIRRVMLERLGFDAYLRQMNAVILDRDSENLVDLYRVNSRWGEQRATVSTCHTTGRQYVQFVPPGCQTVQEAMCRRYGVDVYNPVAQS